MPVLRTRSASQGTASSCLAPPAHAVGRGEGGGGAFAVGGNQFGDVAFIEAVAQPSRALRARSGAIYRAGEYHGVAKQQVSGSHGVRVRGKELHR
jgi:hypothetical protein